MIPSMKNVRKFNTSASVTKDDIGLTFQLFFFFLEELSHRGSLLKFYLLL